MQKIITVLEELFPFIFFIKRAKRKLKEANSSESENSKALREQYSSLTIEELLARLNEEHERGKNIDEKTIKFSVTISLALTILGSAGSVVLKSITNPDVAFVVSISLALSVIYTISGGLLALGALKTLPTYGFGTFFLIQKKKSDAVCVSALISQEKVNVVRHLRNESSYQCLRNGLLLLLFSLFIYTISPTTKYVGENDSKPTIEKLKKSPKN